MLFLCLTDKMRTVFLGWFEKEKFKGRVDVELKHVSNQSDAELISL